MISAPAAIEPGDVYGALKVLRRCESKGKRGPGISAAVRAGTSGDTRPASCAWAASRVAKCARNNPNRHRGENMRNPSVVLDEILKVAPDLEPHFASTRTSMKYAAPEVQHSFWNRIASILNDVAADHPNQAEIGAIFSGQNTAAQ